MRMRTTRIAVYMVLCLMVAALVRCSDGDTVVIKVKQANWCGEVAKVVCSNMFKCCTGDQIEKVLGETITTSESACRRDIELICTQKQINLHYGLTKKTVTVDTEKATACLKEMMVTDACFMNASKQPWKQSCNGDQDTMVEHIFTGTQGAGDECMYAAECKPDHKCGVDRKCKALAKAGESCSAYSGCASKHYCDSKTSKCVALSQAGGKCTSSAACAKKHYCALGTSGTGVCRKLLSGGSACTGSTECESAYCIPGKCPSGGSCYKDSDCKGSCKMSPTLTCKTDSQCPGKCANSGKTCYDKYSCDYTTNEQCVTDKCLTGGCQGKAVCSEKMTLINYCTDPKKSLGI